MNKVWLEQYPEGVPAEINPELYGSAVELISEAVEKFGERDAFTNYGTFLSYQEFDLQAYNFAAYLQNTLGLEKGHRVAVMLPNILQAPIAVYGCLRAGLVVANTSPYYSALELEYQLNNADVDTIVLVSDASSVLADVIANTRVETVIVTGENDLRDNETFSIAVDNRLQNVISFTEALEQGAEQSLQAVEVSRDDLAFLQYTSGTTALSKGAMLTHGNVVAIIAQVTGMLGPKFKGDEVFVTALPLYHIFALADSFMTCLFMGGLNVLITDPKNYPEFVAELSKWRFSYISGSNTLYNGLMEMPGFADLDFSKLELAISGGMPTQESIWRRWRELTGCLMLEGYGLSETAATVTSNPVDITDFTDSIGIPIPSTEVSIRDSNNIEVPLGLPGELCARGPQITKGYWGLSQQTREAFTPDGMLRTGDIVTMDEKGFITFLERSIDVIIVAGRMVFPRDVENTVFPMAGVQECICVAAPDAKTGQAVALFVVSEAAATINEAEIAEHCRQHLDAYQVPSKIIFTETVPKNPVGKILRRKLREQLQ